MLTPMLVIAGLGIGFVVNWLADRLPANHPHRRAIAADVTCPRCAAAHRIDYWRYLIRQWVCPECNLRPRFRPVLTILATGVLLVVLWRWCGGNAARFGLGSVVASLFLLVTIIDVEHHLILWKVTMSSAGVIGIASGMMTDWTTTLLGGLVGFGLMLVVYLLGVALFKQDGIGAGDVILAGVAGLAVGADRLLPALVTAMMVGGIVALALLAWGAVRRRSMRSRHLAYAPLILLGTCLAYLIL